MTIAAETPMLTAQDIRDVMTDQFSHFLSDIERRVAQAYDIERRGGQPRGTVYTEDLNTSRHMIEGYTLTNNTPANHITWASVTIVYNGTSYAMAGGSTATTEKYVWFDAAVSTTVLQKGTNKPALTGNACLVFINNSGIGVSVLESDNFPAALADNAVDTGALQNLAITGGKIANQAITTTQISNSANITGSQLSSSAGLVGTQLTNGTLTSTQINASANILGSQLSSSAGIVGGQIANGAIGPLKTALFTHLIY